MDVYGIHIPDKALTNLELLEYAKQLNIPKFRGVFMRNTLPKKPHEIECGIVNLNTSLEPGSHWVAYYKNKKERIYFDSYGQVVLAELNDYLKTKEEKKRQSCDLSKYRHCTKIQHSSMWSSVSLCIEITLLR